MYLPYFVHAQSRFMPAIKAHESISWLTDNPMNLEALGFGQVGAVNACNWDQLGMSRFRSDG